MTKKTRQDTISSVRFKEGDGRVLTATEIQAIDTFERALKNHLGGGTGDKSLDTVMFLKKHRLEVVECFKEAFETGFFGRNPELTVGLLRYHISLGKSTAHRLIHERFAATPETLQWLEKRYDDFADKFQQNIISPLGR